MIEAAEASGELEPGPRAARADSGNTGISLALVAKLKGYPLTCVLPENATEERRRLLRALRRDDRRLARRARARTAPSGSRSSSPSGSRATSCRSSTRTRRTRAPTTRAPARRSPTALDRVDVLVAGLGTGGTLMGAGARLRESFPDVVVAAAEPLPGDPVMGLRSLEDGYVPPILDVVEARPEAARLERGGGRGRARAARRARAIFAGVSRGAVVHVARRLADELEEGVVVCVLADGGWKYLSRRLLGRGRRRDVDGARSSGGSPAAVREALAEHARDGAPNEACGLLVLRDGVAERYEPRTERRRVAVPVRARGRPASCGSSRTRATSSRSSTRTSPSPPRPSRTDVENIGLWEGRPYLIYSLARRRARRVDDRRRRDRAARAELTRPMALPGRSGLVLSTYSVTESRCGRSTNLTAIRSMRLPSTSSTSKRMPSYVDVVARLGARGRAGRRRSRRRCGSPRPAARCRSAR